MQVRPSIIIFVSEYEKKKDYRAMTTNLLSERSVSVYVRLTWGNG